MASESTWRVHGEYIVHFYWFWHGITMVSLWTWISLDHVNLHLSKGLQWFREFMVVSSSQARFRKGAKSASGAPGQKSTPRGSKSATFAQGLFQPFNLQNIGTNPIGEPSVLPFQHPIYLWLQASASKVVGIGGWCVLSTDFEIYGSSIGVYN